MSTLHQLFTEYCNQKIRSVATDIPGEAKQEIVRQLKGSLFRSVVQAWSVLDFYDYRHLYAEGYEHYFGYDDATMSAERILEIIHPEDQEAFGNLYYLCLEGLLHMPIPVKDIGHFCVNYRIKSAAGNYVRVLETNSIIASDEARNIPLICLSQMSKLDGMEASSPVSYYFLLFRDEWESVDIMAKFLQQYSPVVNMFTQSEMKIIRLLKQGLTSKEIADRIFLSKHTIDKYRKNLLEKTNCANTAQLLAHVLSLGIL